MNPRLLPVLWRSSLVSLRALWRVTRQIFHEAMGTVFAVFALYGGLAAWRQWKTRPIAWLIAFSIAYAIMMLVFSFVAFRRARRLGHLENMK
jgi:glycerol uptake facilitator-like aquaporin